jgi:hypothetical protein
MSATREADRASVPPQKMWRIMKSMVLKDNSGVNTRLRRLHSLNCPCGEHRSLVWPRRIKMKDFLKASFCFTFSPSVSFQCGWNATRSGLVIVMRSAWDRILKYGKILTPNRSVNGSGYQPCSDTVASQGYNASIAYTILNPVHWLHCTWQPKSFALMWPAKEPCYRSLQSHECLYNVTKTLITQHLWNVTSE